MRRAERLSGRPLVRLFLPSAALAYTLGVLVACYVAAQLAEARHASWVALGLGLPAAAAGWALRPRPRAAAAPASALPRTLLWPATVGLFLLVLLPVLVTRLPPMDDYPNHLARIGFMATGGHDPLLARFYAIRWHLIPNLGMDLLLPPVAAVTGVFAAGKLFLIASMLLLLAGPLAIQRALFGRHGLGPLVAVLFAYNGVTKMGVLNYEFGVGLALFATAGWIALRDRAPVLRGSVSFLCVVVLFLCHLEALGIYGLAIGSYELWRAWSGPRRLRPLLGDAAALALPFLPAIPLWLLGPVKHGAYATPTEWGGLHLRIDGLRFLFATYSPRLDLVAMLAMLAGLAVALRRRMLSLHPFGWVMLGVMAVAYLAVPNVIFGTWGAAARLPLAVLLLLLGALRWHLPTPRARAAFLAALTALALFRTATVEAAFRRFDRIAADMQSSLALIPRGSRVLVAAADAPRTDAFLGAIQELPLLAMIERSCLVSLAYTHPLQQVLAVRAPYRASTGGFGDQAVPLRFLLAPPAAFPARRTPLFDPSGRIYWRDWAHTYDVVYVIDRADPASPAPGRLAPLMSGARFQLYRVMSARPAAAAPPPPR